MRTTRLPPLREDEKYRVVIEVDSDGGGRLGGLRDWALNLATTRPPGLVAVGYDVHDEYIETQVKPPTLISRVPDLEGKDLTALNKALMVLTLLDRERQAHKDYFEEYRKAVSAVVDIVGKDFHWQDEQGVVYRIVEPEGTFVKFDKLALERTRRPGEKKGSMSMEDGRRLGYEVEGK